MGRVDIATGEEAQVEVFDTSVTVPSDADFGVSNGAGTFHCAKDGLTLTVEQVAVDLHPSQLPDMSGWE